MHLINDCLYFSIRPELFDQGIHKLIHENSDLTCPNVNCFYDFPKGEIDFRSSKFVEDYPYYPFFGMINDSRLFGNIILEASVILLWADAEKMKLGLLCRGIKNYKKESIEEFAARDKLLAELEYQLISDFIAIRKEKGLSQQEMGKASETIRETIAKIENQIISPGVNTLIKILKPFGYTINIMKIKDK